MPLDAPASAPAGFVWKSLFLPAGTKVWMRCAGAEHEAVVSDGALVWGDLAVSPTDFANQVAGHARNAWRDLWLLRPGIDADFRLADDLRAELLGEHRPLKPRPSARVPAAPKKAAVLSLVPFLVRAGGLRDDRGDVLAILGGSHRVRPGLISRRGLALDRAASLALEAGYFPELGAASAGREAESLVGKIASAGRDADPVTVRDLLDMIDWELRGRLCWPEGLAPELAADPAVERDAIESAAASWNSLAAAAADGPAAALAFLVSAGLLSSASLAAVPAPAPAPVLDFVAYDDASCPF